MRSPLPPIGALALGMLLVSATVPAAAEPESGLRPENPTDQQEKNLKLQQHNLQEKQRLQAPSQREGSPDIPYTENQPIGGQKQGGLSDFPQPAFPWVKGELTQIEGEHYVVRDAEGKDIRIHVDKGTKMEDPVKVGDFIEAKRTLEGHAVSIRQASSAPQTSPSSASSGAGRDKPIGDEQVTLGGAKQAIRGEVLKVDGQNYVVKDGHGNEVRLAVNQNTRMFCGGENKPQGRDLQSTQCQFKPGEMIEAEVSDMGAATFIKQAGRAQPGQPLP